MRMREGKEGGGKGPLVSEDQSLTLATGNDQVLAYAETAGTLRAQQGSGFRSNGTPVDGLAFHGMQVRRLTPTECARLQGFPDDYLSQVTFRGKCPPADGVMYKALGNSWAVPCARWIGERIKAIRP
jgi:site-specific DNA-cytosine methylase